MGWLRRLVMGSDLGDIAERDAAEMMARNNILEASRRDERRRRMLDSPPPVVRWRHQHRSWMRWSELDADWIFAEIPEGLLAFAATLDEVPDGTVVGFVDERWQILDPDGVDPVSEPEADADVPPPPAVQPSAEQPVEPAVDPSADPAEPTLSVAEQIEAWRRRT